MNRFGLCQVCVSHIYRVIQKELPPLTELISDDILSKKCHINLGPILSFRLPKLGVLKNWHYNVPGNRTKLTAQDASAGAMLYKLTHFVRRFVLMLLSRLTCFIVPFLPPIKISHYCLIPNPLQFRHSPVILPI
jgi:hypothetical protein